MNSMLASAIALVREAAKDLGDSDAKVEAFLQPEHEYSFNVTAGGRSFPAYRVQHSSKLGPYKGGVRFHPNVTVDEVRALALLMSLKTAAVGLPLGGGKGGVAVDPQTLSPQELEDLSRDYARQLAPHMGPDVDIPAPDVNTDARIMDWMLDEYQQVTNTQDKAAFTGKSLSNGGSQGRTAATGRGGVIALMEYLRRHDMADKPLTVALQGFGNVGYYFAAVLGDYPNIKLIAIANSKATWLQPSGIDVTKVTGAVQDEPRPEQLVDLQGVEPQASNAIIGVKADILVLAALENAVTESNMHDIQATIVVELANGPINKAAEEFLASKHIAVLPDVIANAGGVIVSYLEWLQNKAGEHWPEDQVNQKLANTLVPAVQAMTKRAAEKNLYLKAAAFQLAIERLIR